jgi:O-antigen ligase
LIITFDYVSLNILGFEFHLGRIHLEYGINPRPHAWYQEPNYFAGFAMISAIWIRQRLGEVKNSADRKFFGFVYVALAFGLVFCTSRLGWLGLIAMGLFELARPFMNRLQAKEFDIGKFIRTKAAAAALLISSILMMGASPQLLGESQNIIDLIEHSNTPINLLKRPSLMERIFNADAAYQVFRTHPWLGVGPGAAGADLVNHFPNHLYLQSEVRSLDAQRNDPLSFSLYLELLSEWGILGTIFFLIGVAFFFRNAPIQTRILGALLLGISYVTCQTLPRFDVWVALSMIWAIQSAPPRLLSAKTSP